MSRFDYARMSEGVIGMTVRFEDVPGKYIDAWIGYKNAAKRLGYDLELTTVEFAPYFPNDMLMFFYSSKMNGFIVNSSVFIDSTTADERYFGKGYISWVTSLSGFVSG